MATARTSGVTIPLFSVRTRSDWGIGQITDLPACADLFLRAGQHLIQVLPAHELADGETSPYGALSAFALDPIYIDVDAVPDVDAALVADALGEDGSKDLVRVRAASRVDYGTVRRLKRTALRSAFHRFREREAKKTVRGTAFMTFVTHEAAWLRDHALYAAIRASHNGYGWSTWPANERDRAPEILALAA